MHRKLLAVLLVCCSSFAAHAIEVETAELPRDVKAWYAADDTLPVVQVILSFEGAGYASDPEGKRGLAQLAAQAVLEGAGTYDALAFQEALESRAIDISSSVSADRLILSIHTLKEHAAFAGKMARLALSAPRLEASDLTRLKEAQKAALQRAGEGAAYRVSRQFSARAFGDHPYANPPLGEAATIDMIQAEDIRAFANTYLTSGNLKISISGDVEEGSIQDMLAELVEALPRNETGSVDVAAISVRQQGVFSDDSLNVPQSSVLFAAPGIRRSDPEFYAAYLLMHIVGGDGLTSRLVRELRQAEGLVYSASASLDEMRGAVLVNGSLSTRNETRDAAIEKVKEVLGDVYLNGVTTQECEDARAYVKGHFPLQMDTTERVAQMLLSMQIYDLGQDYIAKRQEYFDAVRCGDINQAAKSLLDPSRFLFVSVGGKAAQGNTP